MLTGGQGMMTSGKHLENCSCFTLFLFGLGFDSYKEFNQLMFASAVVEADWTFKRFA